MSMAPPSSRVNELRFTSQRDGQEIAVSARVTDPAEGPGFRAVDLLASPPGERDIFAPLRSGITGLPEGTLTGMCGITLPAGHPGEGPATFAVSVTLADTHEVAPEAVEPIGPDVPTVTPFTLAGRPGQRRAQLTVVAATEDTVIPMLTITYVASTEYGILTLAFGTVHLDAASIFAQLFDTVAASVEVGYSRAQ